MADVVHVTQFDHALGQQAQRPSCHTFRSIAAGQHRQFGLDLARELGLSPRPALIIQGIIQPNGQKPSAHVDYRALAAPRRIGYFLVRALLALAAVAQKQDTRSGMGAGRSVAGADQLLKLSSLFYRQFDLCMLTHAAQSSGFDQKNKILPTEPLDLTGVDSCDIL
jgi:hypothetical protein